MWTLAGLAIMSIGVAVFGAAATLGQMCAGSVIAMAGAVIAGASIGDAIFHFATEHPVAALVVAALLGWGVFELASLKLATMGG